MEYVVLGLLGAAFIVGAFLMACYKDMAERLTEAYRHRDNATNEIAQLRKHINWLERQRVAAVKSLESDPDDEE